MKNKNTRSYNSQIRQKQAEDTRNRIADTADRLIKSHGYENTTIGAIAKGAGVAPQTVYAIFSSKQGILMYLLKRSMHKSAAGREGAVKAAESLSKLPERIARATRFTNAQQQEAMSALGGFEILYPELYDLVRKASELRRELIADDMKRQSETEKNTYLQPHLEDKLDLIWALTDGSLYHNLTTKAGWSPEYFEKILAQLVEQCLTNIDFER